MPCPYIVTQSDASRLPAPPGVPLLCGGCGFDLRATTADRCPECGRRFDPAHLITDLIPWEQRKYVGRVRAYVWTVLLVTFLPWKVADKVARPVSLRDARGFRRTTVFIALAGLVGGVLLLRPWATENFGKSAHWQDEWAKLFTSPWSFAVAAAGVLLGLSAASQVTVAFFGGKRTRNRTARVRAIGHYASAPLAWLLPAVAYSALVAQVQEPVSQRDPYETQYFAVALAQRLTPFPFVLAGILLVLWLWSTLALLRRATACGWGRVLSAAITLPLIWTSLLVLTPLLLELLLALVVVIVISLG